MKVVSAILLIVVIKFNNGIEFTTGSSNATITVQSSVDIPQVQTPVPLISGVNNPTDAAKVVQGFSPQIQPTISPPLPTTGQASVPLNKFPITPANNSSAVPTIIPQGAPLNGTATIPPATPTTPTNAQPGNQIPPSTTTQPLNTQGQQQKSSAVRNFLFNYFYISIIFITFSYALLH